MSLLFSNCSMIVAVSKNGVIGKENSIPWDLPEDLKWFREKTKGNSIIMGRKTFESLGYRALPDRVNIVVSTNDPVPSKKGKVYYANNLQTAAYMAESLNPDKEIFFIGGSRIYEEASNFVKTLYKTEINQKVKGDTYFPEIDMKQFEEIQRRTIIKTKENPEYSFITYKRIENEKQEED